MSYTPAKYKIIKIIFFREDFNLTWIALFLFQQSSFDYSVHFPLISVKNTETG